MAAPVADMSRPNEGSWAMRGLRLILRGRLLLLRSASSINDGSFSVIAIIRKLLMYTFNLLFYSVFLQQLLITHPGNVNSSSLGGQR